MAQEKLNWQQPIEEQPRTKAVQPKKPKKQPKHGKHFLVLFLGLAIMLGLGIETVHLTIVKGAQIRNLKQDIAALEYQNELLKVKREELRAIGRIESAALAMGMEKPAGTVYVAGVLPEIKSQSGTSTPQVAAATPIESKSESTLKEISHLFTSFFASTQR